MTATIKTLRGLSPGQGKNDDQNDHLMVLLLCQLHRGNVSFRFSNPHFQQSYIRHYLKTCTGLQKLFNYPHASITLQIPV